MSNVNCIRKNNTDYMYEDTAGRSLIGTEQENLTAVEAYAVGDLFWYNDTLYRVTTAIALNGAIVITGGSENAVATTVSEELARRVLSTDLTNALNLKQDKAITSMTIEGQTATTVNGALTALNDTKAGLTDLAPTFSTSTAYAKGDCVTYNGDVYRFNAAHSAGAWIGTDVDQISVTEAGGHAMIPVYDNNNNEIDIQTMQALDSSDVEDNWVINAYTAQRWANCDVVTLLATASRGTDTMGEWETDWKASGASRTGWLWSEALYQVLEDSNGNSVQDIEITPIFDIHDSEVISLYAYRIDDDYPMTIDGVQKNGGCVAFKFNNAVSSADGVTVGLNLKHQRINVIPLVEIPAP